METIPPDNFSMLVLAWLYHNLKWFLEKMQNVMWHYYILLTIYSTFTSWNRQICHNGFHIHTHQYANDAWRFINIIMHVRPWIAVRLLCFTKKSTPIKSGQKKTNRYRLKIYWNKIRLLGTPPQIRSNRQYLSSATSCSNKTSARYWIIIFGMVIQISIYLVSIANSKIRLNGRAQNFLSAA